MKAAPRSFATDQSTDRVYSLERLGTREGESSRPSLLLCVRADSLEDLTRGLGVYCVRGVLVCVLCRVKERDARVVHVNVNGSFFSFSFLTKVIIRYV